MKTVKVEISIPDTDSARAALDATVIKINKAHRAAELLKGNKTPNVVEVKTPEPKAKKEIKVTIDLTDKDIKSLIKANKLDLDTRKKAIDLRHALEDREDIKDLVDKYKQEALL